MDISFNIYSVTLFFGVFQGVLFGLIFLFRAVKNKRLSDLLMGFLLSALAIQILPFMLSFMGSTVMWNELLFFPFHIGLIIGPMIFFYLKSQTNTDFRFHKKHLWHLLPYVIYLTYHLSVFAQGKSFVQHWVSQVHLTYHIPLFFGLLCLLSNYIYLLWSVRYYNEYRDWLESEFSNTEQLDLAWYKKYLFLAISGITISWVFYGISSLGYNLTYTQNWWEYVLLSVIIYVVSLSAYNQPQVIYLKFKPTQVVPPEKKSILPDDALETAKQKVLALLEEDKIYLDSKLTLSDMAAQINISPNVLSQVINAGFEKNFNQLINDYRVREFKAAARQPENKHLSLLAIAMDCGFNSKATFNRAFKSIAGISPREFLGGN
ncbi:MAG: AraC family transcriptional regulator [Bacteroidota bacterium]